MGLAQVQEVAVKKTKSSVKQKSLPKKLSLKKINDLVIEHRDHGRRLAWSFLSSWRIRLPQDDVISVVGAALCEAAHRFDPSREVAFKTFFFYHLRGMLLKEISRMIDDQKLMQLSTGTDSEPVVSASWDYTIVENENPEKIIEKKELSLACWRACQKLDDLEKEVLMRYFVNDEPLIEIANNLNYCRCHISRVKSRALVKLSKHLSEELGKDLADIERIRLPKKSDIAKSFTSYKGGRGRRKKS